MQRLCIALLFFLIPATALADTVTIGRLVCSTAMAVGMSEYIRHSCMILCCREAGYMVACLRMRSLH